MKCNLCPRACNVDRDSGKTGYCGETSQIRVARTSLHQWEEPCITGEYGSGTVFFTGCNLRCVFCQNHNIADGSVGQVFTVEELAQAFLRLQEKKASNINLVTAGHFAGQVAEALKRAKANGLTIPIVYNSSGYEAVESLRFLDGLVDVYLPDCKYFSPEISKNYSHAEEYFEVAAKAVEEMVRQVGEPVFDEKGIMQKGVIVRHLVLPGHTKDSMAVLDYLWHTYRDKVYISVMNQYTPMGELPFEELNRTVSGRSYERAVDYAIELGIEQCMIQEGGAIGDSFIPAFDGTGILRPSSASRDQNFP